MNGSYWFVLPTPLDQNGDCSLLANLANSAEQTLPKHLRKLLRKNFEELDTLFASSGYSRSRQEVEAYEGQKTMDIELASLVIYQVFPCT